MKQITSEFKDSISTDTVSQMNSLAENLSKSSDVLNTIHQNYDYIPINANYFLQLHIRNYQLYLHLKVVI